MKFINFELEPTLENVLRAYFGEVASILALEEDKKHLSAICTTGAFAEISKGYRYFEKYHKREEQYKKWHVDNFNAEANLPTINNGVALAFKQIYLAGTTILDTACEEIKRLHTVTQDTNLASTIASAYDKGTVDRPSITIWSTLVTKVYDRYR